jgi:hypothetical protein
VNILLIATAISAIATASLAFVMHTSLNSKLPENEQLGWTNRWNPSISTLCNLYDRFFPDNYLAPLLRITSISICAFGIALLTALWISK